MMKKRLLTAIMVAVMMVGNAMGENPKREMRATWMATVKNIDWPSSSSRGTTAQKQAAQKQELIAYLDNLEALNMTSTCLQVRSMGDAMYPSELAPWSSYISGTRGVDPGWDPLAFFVEEAHKRGIEAYVWLNPYRWSSSGYSWNTEKDMEWRNSGMLIAGTSKTNYITFNPALPETRQLIVDVIKEILNNYAIDGILFDDYFYPSGGTTEGSSAPDYADYKSSGTTMSIGDWRRRNVNDMVADCYNAVKELRPDVRFGIGPAGVSTKSASKYGLPSLSSYGSTASDWQYAKIYSDPLTWMNEGTVDFITPQLYWETTHSTNGYAALTHWWSDVSEIFNCHYYASQASYQIPDSGWEVSEIETQVNLNRQYVKNNNCGSIFYNTVSFKNHLASLANSVYSTPALSPEITWKGGDSYGKVANLIYKNGTLTWDATVNGNAIIRYTVYAVPSTVTFDNAKAADGDGIDGKYLQKVVYGTSYTLVADKQSNHWYVVCVMDGYSKEHEITVVNYPEGESETVTLTSPVNGAKATWETEFVWSSVENGTYCVEIASDAQMSDVIFTQKNITTNRIMPDLSMIEDAKTCYWRVRTSQPNKLESVSEVASFVSADRNDAIKAKLLTPSNGANVENVAELKWEGDKYAEKYTVDIAADEDFNSILYSTETVEQAVNIPAIAIEKGVRYWRVESRGRKVNKSISDTGVFTVVGLGVGYAEEGYEIMKDADNYADKNSITIENLWMRSVKEEFANISFVESGNMNRDFVAKGKYVYIVERENIDKTSKAYLKKYHGLTGEHVGDILITNMTESTYTCNTITKDSRGNVCVANMSTAIDTDEIYVSEVDVNTGSAILVATLKSNNGGRIDFVSVHGDVESDCFYVFGALKSTKTVMRWTVKNGVASEELCTLKALYPTSATTLATAPHVIPIDENRILVDGSKTYLTLYDFATGEILQTFEENSDMTPTEKSPNGAHVFTLNGKTYLIYGNDKNNMRLATIDSDFKFSSLSALWVLPQSGMGDVSSGAYNNPADFVPIDNRSGIVYVYVPGNGVAAYLITDTSVSSISDITIDKECEVEYYDLLGNRVISPSHGIYIKKQGQKVEKIAL